MVEAHSADVIATLVLLKKEVEIEKRTSIKLTITGATEAHILAKELGEADVGVVVSPSRPFPTLWEDRRMYEFPLGLWNSDLTYLTVFLGLLLRNTLVFRNCLPIM